MEQFIKEKLEGIDMDIIRLQEEKERLKQQLNKSKGLKGMERWVGYEFESSCGSTPEFLAFTKDFKRCIKDNLPNEAELATFSKGHFDISGFVKRGEKYVYFSISDVRHFRDGWYNDVLIRTAENDKDYTGGSNSQTDLNHFKENVDYLLNR